MAKTLVSSDDIKIELNGGDVSLKFVQSVYSQKEIDEKLGEMDKKIIVYGTCSDEELNGAIRTYEEEEIVADVESVKEQLVSEKMMEEERAEEKLYE